MTTAADSEWDGRSPLRFPPWGVAELRLTFPNRTYAWAGVPIDNPYLGPEQGGIDPVALRKWRAAVVANLVRERDTDRVVLATVRRWSEVSWARVSRALFPTRHKDDHGPDDAGRAPEGARGYGDGPSSPQQRLVCLGIAHLCLLAPVTPLLYRARGKRENATRRAVALEVVGLVDPVTGGPPRTAARLDLRTFLERFGSLPPVRRPGALNGAVPLHPAYAPFTIAGPPVGTWIRTPSSSKAPAESG